MAKKNRAKESARGAPEGKRERKKLQKPLSLYPLTFDEALDKLLAYKPEKKSPNQIGSASEKEDGDDQYSEGNKISHGD